MDKGSNWMSGNFYNEIVKNQFLEKFQGESKNTYAHVFKKSKELEELIGIDLYYFKINQIEALLKKFKFSTIRAARTYLSVISSYLHWAVEMKFVENVTQLKEVKDEWLLSFVEVNKTLFTDTEIEYVEDNLVNYQDKVIPRLIFEGVSLTELLNLTITDVINSTLKLKDEDNQRRELIVSDRAIEFINKASTEKVYLLKNGNSVGKRTSSELVDNDFIIKSTLVKSVVNFKQADKHLVYRRLAMISDLFEGYKYFNVSNISRSGKLKLAKEFYIKDGSMTDEHLLNIQNRFGYKTKMKTPDFYRLLSIKEIITIESIRDLYNL